MDGETTLTKSQTARRERVLRAALDLGATGGYDAVQMRDVATSAGVALDDLPVLLLQDHLLAAAMVEWTHGLERRVGQRPPRATRSRSASTRCSVEPPGPWSATQTVRAVVTALLSPDRGAAMCQQSLGR